MRFVQTQRRLASHTAWRSQFCCSTGLGRILGSLCSPPAHRFALPSRHQAVLDNLSLAQKQPAQPRVHPKPYRRDTRERRTAARMQPRMERRNEVTAPPASPPPDAATPHPHSPPVPRPLALHPCPPPGHLGLLSPLPLTVRRPAGHLAPHMASGSSGAGAHCTPPPALLRQPPARPAAACPSPLASTRCRP